MRTRLDVGGPTHLESPNLVTAVRTSHRVLAPESFSLDSPKLGN